MNNNTDNKASQRKNQHISLAFDSQTPSDSRDLRFNYEPAIGTMASNPDSIKLNFLGKNLDAPIWVSSMTGGTELAGVINRNLAKACHEFGLGMGLGSCRQLLEDDTHLKDFAMRDYIGLQPLYANLGIAQVIDIVEKDEYDKITSLVDKLRADGLIIHINPIQEWMQPEGDLILMSPLECISKVLKNTPVNIIVKEVGQGFGPKSLRELLKLPIQGLELAGYGGTNFAQLEALRQTKPSHLQFVKIGHTAEEMVDYINILADEDFDVMKKDIIISGGIKDYLTGFYLNEKCQLNSVYGQASQFLHYAMEDYSALSKYIENQIEGYLMAKSYLTIT